MSIPAPPRRSGEQGEQNQMTQYMLLLGGADIDKRSGNPRLAEEMMGRYMKWLQGLKAGGHYVSSQKLKDQTGARLSLRGGEVVEGPFPRDEGGRWRSFHHPGSFARTCRAARARLPSARPAERLHRGTGDRGSAPCRLTANHTTSMRARFTGVSSRRSPAVSASQTSRRSRMRRKRRGCARSLARPRNLAPSPKVG